MSDRKVVHVLYRDEKWKLKIEGNSGYSGSFDTKDETVERGKEVAKNAPLGQIKIHKKDGSIQTEHTYKKDPKKYRG